MKWTIDLSSIPYPIQELLSAVYVLNEQPLHDKINDLSNSTIDLCSRSQPILRLQNYPSTSTTFSYPTQELFSPVYVLNEQPWDGFAALARISVGIDAHQTNPIKPRSRPPLGGSNSRQPPLQRCWCLSGRPRFIYSSIWLPSDSIWPARYCSTRGHGTSSVPAPAVSMALS